MEMGESVMGKRVGTEWWERNGNFLGFEGREVVDHLVGVDFAWVEDGGGEVWVVDGVGVGFGLEANAGSGGEGNLVVAEFGGVEEISRVNVDGGLVGGEGEEASGGGAVERDFCVFAKNPGVVVAVGELDGGEVALIDACADGGFLAEIERCVGEIGDFSRGDHAGGSGEVGIGVDLEEVIGDGEGGISAEIPVGVGNEVDEGRLVGSGAGLEDELVFIVKAVGDLDGKVAGVAFVAVGGVELVGDVLGAGVEDAPFAVGEADGAAVEVAGDACGGVVRGELVVGIFERKCSVGDAIADASDEGAHVEGIAQPCFFGGVAEGDVGEIAVGVWGEKAAKGGAVGGEFGAESVAILESVDHEDMFVRGEDRRFCGKWQG